MKDLERYKHLNNYLKNKFGERTLKICIDGGFSCPNRDGTLSTGGCIFCSQRGSGELINCSFNQSIQSSIQNQVINYFNSYRSSRANKFIVYFQNFTNTYDSLENLKAKYDAALIDDRIVGLEIATRPDCIDDSICKLLSTYKDKYYVCVELGLQTSNDNTGVLINRGYSSGDFTKAVSLLNKYNIDVVVHIMVGLPSENSDDLKNTIDFVNSHIISGIKIHSAYVLRNTKLAEMYLSGNYIPMTFDYYMNSLTYIITHLKPTIVVHRISGDPPKDLLLAPNWTLRKKLVLNGLDKILKDNDLYQGIYYEKK